MSMFPGSILEAILAHKKQEVEARKGVVSSEQLQRRAGEMALPRDFPGAIRDSKRTPALIGEIKLSSPSRGSLCSCEKAVTLPGVYAAGGAACLSVVTDGRFFGGEDRLLVKAREDTFLPVLRKDFVVDEYQIWESRVLGADAVLLIVACLGGGHLVALSEVAREVRLPVLVEVHNEEEVEAALGCEPEMIGINNRDLFTFQVSLETTLRLRPLVPDSMPVVSESGFGSREDVLRVQEVGVDAILVGERLVTAEAPLQAIRELYGEEGP